MSTEREKTNNGSGPKVIAVEMGYGHLRAAHNVAESFGTEVMRMDLPPVAGPAEAALWRAALLFYTSVSQACDSPFVGRTARAVLDLVTGIPPLPQNGRIEPPNLLAHLADRLTSSLLCQGLRAQVSKDPSCFIATYPVAAMAARHIRGARVFCLVTDTDLNRAWVPPDPADACIDFLAPVPRVVDRLRSFGVPETRIHLTGFPLPARLVDQAYSSLARRLHRLDPKRAFLDSAGPGVVKHDWDQAPAEQTPITLTFAVGGAGGQTHYVGQILHSMRERILRGEFQINLVAGTRADVARIFGRMLQSSGLPISQGGVKILSAHEPREYFRKFEDCLADTDILWTKPSELVFYAALGLPILLAPPVGGQEYANRDWILSHDAGIDMGEPSRLDEKLQKWLSEGKLAHIASNAYSRLDRNGLQRILGIVEKDQQINNLQEVISLQNCGISPSRITRLNRDRNH
jgi:hypothetical protein